MRDVNFSIDTIRILLHVLGVSVWVGGQIAMVALLPVLRAAGVDDLPATAARAFNKVAWPAFGLAFFTGVWNLMVQDGSATTTYNVVFGIKFLLVIASGAAAFIHSTTTSPALRGATGGIGFLAALGAMVLGFGLAH